MQNNYLYFHKKSLQCTIKNYLLLEIVTRNIKKCNIRIATNPTGPDKGVFRRPHCVVRDNMYSIIFLKSEKLIVSRPGVIKHYR